LLRGKEVGKMYKHDSSEEVSPTNSSDSEADKKPSAQPDIEEGIRVRESKSQETDINIQSSSSTSHQPDAHTSRTRLRLNSSERESRSPPVAPATCSQSAERVNAQVIMPQITQNALSPNGRGQSEQPNKGKGKPKRLDFC